MKIHRLISFGVFFFVLQVSGAPYQELVPGFNRIKSNAMVRKIDVPTLANLDYAAYDKNPVLFEPAKVKPKAPKGKISLESVAFGGVISEVRNSIGETPLTDGEKNSPLAWRPLIKKLWDVVKDQSLQNLGSSINGYKWADPDVYQAYQDVTTAYLHDVQGVTEIWIKVEFSPWVKFLKVVSDEDKDGIRELYGKLNVSKIQADSLKKAVEWIRTDYMVRVPSAEGMTDWITDLASYWYPTKNTDIIDMNGQENWPNAQTKKIVLPTLKKISVKNPLAVVEGKPFAPDKPIYNVYVVENREKTEAVVAPTQNSVVAADRDTLVSQNFNDNQARWAGEVKSHGDYAAWAKEFADLRAGIGTYVQKLPPQQMGYKGKEDWVFFRKDIEYLNAGDLNAQPKDKNPVPNLLEFQKFLAERNINMLFVAVPNKSEVYYDKLPLATVPKDATAIINPYSRKILADAQAAGIEVIDLLPAFLKAKADDANHKEPVYQKQDTHWTDRGLEIAAKLIADRIKQYSWYSEAAKSAVGYVLTDTTFSRQGDIVDKLPEAEKASYPAVVLSASQVKLPDGTRFKSSNPTSPILLIGDSFTGVYELVDCKSAGVGAHIAANTGIPTDIITSWGGGPLVREKMLRAREKDLPNKRLIIYMMVSRDLYNYAEGWAPLEKK